MTDRINFSVTGETAARIRSRAVEANVDAPGLAKTLMDVATELPRPITTLVANLMKSNDPVDREALDEFLRKFAMQANAELYKRGKARIVENLPADAFEGHGDEAEEDHSTSAARNVR